MTSSGPQLIRTEQIARPQLKLYSSITLYLALNSFLGQEFNGAQWENPPRQEGQIAKMKELATMGDMEASQPE